VADVVKKVRSNTRREIVRPKRRIFIAPWMIDPATEDIFLKPEESSPPLRVGVGRISRQPDFFNTIGATPPVTRPDG
jgi:hypothetical protein